MKGLLARLFTGRSAAARRGTSLCPDAPFLAVGDLHGRADLLLELNGMIEAEYPDWPLVFLGDYIDRGAESRQVLAQLMAATDRSRRPATCLMGNHERMLLDFLEDPLRHGPRWLCNGGVQTLASFGVAPSGSLDDAAELERLRDLLVAAMGPEVIAWMGALPLAWRSGNVWAVHAGAAPMRPMDRQDQDTLIWGHPQFLRQPRRDGQWIVHGHTIMEAPQFRQGRISLDTGAYATGVLSAAAISQEGVTFLGTRRR